MISLAQVGKLMGSLGRIRREWRQEPRCTVEADHGHAMLNVSNQRVEDRIQLLVVAKVVSPGASSLDDDRQCQRQRICVRIERDMLRLTVIRNYEVGSRELKNYFARFVGRQHRHHYQSGAHCDGWLGSIALLRE